MAEASQLETRKEAVLVGGEAVFWTRQLELAEKDMEQWTKDVEMICDRYKNSSKSFGKNGNKRFNILYSNTEVLKGAVFGRMAVPDVRRRFADQDPMGRLAAEIIERAIIHCNDYNDAKAEYDAAILDYCLGGRGVIRQVYEAEVSSAGEGDQAKEYVAKQEIYDRYIHWKDFRHEPAKCWEDVSWEAFRHKMTRDDLHYNFDTYLGEEEVKKIPLNWCPENKNSYTSKEVENAFKKAEVWEIWDKSKRQRIWHVPGHDKLCKKETDPYGLEGFWPNDEPLHFVKSNDTLIPQPEFLLYKDQADSLDEIETRLDRLTRQLKRRGVYDAAVKELKRISTLADNQFVPVEKWAELQSAGGLKKAYESEDLAPIVAVLAELINQKTQRINTIYEIIGLSDIMRGASDPNETLGAQELKAQFGGSRIRKRQDAVQAWIRNNFRIKAELIAEHFEPQKLAEVTGFQWQPMPVQSPAMLAGMMNAGLGVAPQPDPMTGPQPGQSAAGLGVPPAPPPGPAATVPGMTSEIAPQNKAITPEVIEILRSDKLRSYRIDIETDSTIFEDATKEKESRVELLTAMTQFIGQWVPVIQAQPALLPLAFEMLAFGVRGFKTGRALEDTLEQTRLQLEQAAKAAAANPQGPPPDPAVELKQQELAQRDAQHKEQMAAQDKQHQEKLSVQNKQIDLTFADKQAERDHELEKLLLTHEKEIEGKVVDAQFDKEARTEEAEFDKEARAEDAAISQAATERDAEISADAAERDATHAAERESIKASQKQSEGSASRKPKSNSPNLPRGILDRLTEQIAGAIVQVGSQLAGAIKQVDNKVEQIAAHQAAPVEYIRDPKSGKVVAVKKGNQVQEVVRENGRIKGMH